MINAVGQQPVSNHPAFTGIVLKNIPGNTALSKVCDFVQSGDPSRIIKGSNRRLDRDVIALDIFDGNPTIRCLTKEIEEKVFKNLSKNQDQIPGVEIHKIDDWA